MIRAVMSIVTLLIVSFIVFSMMELVPGNCAERYIAFKNTQGQNITIEDIQAEERRLGLDKPYLIRAFTWMGNVFFKGPSLRIFSESCSKPQLIYLIVDLPIFFTCLTEVHCGFF